MQKSMYHYLRERSKTEEERGNSERQQRIANNEAKGGIRNG